MISSTDGLQYNSHLQHEAAVMQVVERPVPESMLAEAQSKRAELVESVANVDDEVMELFVEENAVLGGTLASAIRRATVANQFVPVFMGSAYKNVGVQLLLDGVSSYLPDPTEARHMLPSPECFHSWRCLHGACSRQLAGALIMACFLATDNRPPFPQHLAQGGASRLRTQRWTWTTRRRSSCCPTRHLDPLSL